MKRSRREALVLLGGFIGAACSPRVAQEPGASPPAATAAPRAATPEPRATTPEARAPATEVAPPTPRALTAATSGPGQPEVPTVKTTPTSVSVLTGVDVLLRQRTGLLRGRTIGLVTNATGRDAQGRSTIDLLHNEPAWHLAALFSPEHGIRGDVDAGSGVDTSVDPQTGLPIYSLYGETTRPTDAMLHGLDTLVYDIQDVGEKWKQLHGIDRNRAVRPAGRCSRTGLCVEREQVFHVQSLGTARWRLISARECRGSHSLPAAWLSQP